MKKGVLSVVVSLMGWMVHATGVLEFSPDTFFVDYEFEVDSMLLYDEAADTLLIFEEAADTLDLMYDDDDYFSLHVIAGDTLVFFPTSDSTLLQPINIKAVLRDLDRTRPNYSYLSVSPRFLRASPFFIELNFNGYHSVMDSFPPLTTDYFLQQKKDF